MDFDTIYSSVIEIQLANKQMQVYISGKQMPIKCFMHNWYSILWTKQLQQWLHWSINQHKNIMFHAVQSTNCSGDCVLTILLRQTFSFAFHLASLFSPNLNLSVALPGSWFLCTNAKRNIETCGALAHICLTVQNYGRQTGSGPWAGGERGRESERAPGKLPWLCLQQKAIVWCGRAAGSKAPAPTGCALGKMPDGGHCWMTSTSP